MKRNKRRILPGTVLLFAFLASSSFYSSCNQGTDKNKNASENDTGQPAAEITLRGKQLALNYCQRCHEFPEPSLLDKKTWIDNVLPNMGWRLGIRENGVDPHADLKPEEEKIIRAAGIYPETPLLSKTEWDEIVAYYRTSAPDEPLPQKNDVNPPAPLTGFEARLIRFDDKALPQTTLLEYDKATSRLYVGDAQNTLYILNKKLSLEDSWQVESAPTDIDFPNKRNPRLLTIGVLNPSDQKLGRLATLDTAKLLPTNGTFIELLPRPVQFASGDLNMDGKEDVVICGFGNHTGKLAWYDGADPTKENILKAMPGARCVTIRDLNHDQKPDIIVLMAQAYEQVSLFYNEGGGRFTEKKLLGFPPVYGVVYFELIDFNKDGFEDIILTNGDNWDLSTAKKNYHGIRIYLNDGKDNFREAWFYPMYGACKAIVRDFNKDGNLDIASVAFFHNHEKPENGFIYLQNEGGFNFKAHTLSQAALGKWLTLEAGDFDRDGDTDIALGSYFQNISELSKLIATGATVLPQLLILLNKKN